MGRKKKEKPRFIVTEFTNPTTKTKSYRVSGTTRSGERIRENMSDRREAEERRFELQNEYDHEPDPRSNRRTILSYDQIADAETAIKELPASQTLTSVVTKYLDCENRLRAKDIDLDKAIHFALNHYKEDIKPVTVHNAINEFLGDKDGLSKQTQNNYAKATRPLLKDPNKPLHEVSADDIRAILKPYTKPRSHRTYKNNLSVFFRWAVRRRYILENPCDMIEGLRLRKSQVGILSLAEIKKLLQASVEYKNSVMAPSIAIALFAGLRPSELEGLTPKDITKDEILVSEGKMRDKLNRIVPLPPVLREWLEAYPYTGRPEGWRTKYRALMDAAQPKHDVPDILRHTSISFQYGRDRDLKIVAYNCGNSPDIITSSYLDILRNQQDIPAFWELSPLKLRESAVKVTLPSVHEIDWPSNSVLAKLVFEKPLTAIGKMLGVSDNAVRKHCLTRGIDLPKNGYWQKKYQSQKYSLK